MQADRALDSLRDRLLLLRSMTAFHDMDDRDLMLMAEHTRKRRFHTGDIVLAEGATPADVHVVIEGKVEVTRHGARMAEVTRGGGIGVTSVLARDPRGVTAIARQPTLTLAVPQEVIHDALQESFTLYRQVLRMQTAGLIAARGALPAHPDRAAPAETGTYPTGEPTLIERVIQARRSPVFTNGNLDAVTELMRQSPRVTYPPGAWLFRAGEPSRFSLRIVYGRVQCTSPAGQRVDVGAGFLLGTMDTWASQPRSFDARADTEIIAYRMDLEPLLTVLEGHFDMAMDLLAVIARSNLVGTPDTATT